MHCIKWCACESSKLVSQCKTMQGCKDKLTEWQRQKERKQVDFKLEKQEPRLADGFVRTFARTLDATKQNSVWVEPTPPPYTSLQVRGWLYTVTQPAHENRHQQSRQARHQNKDGCLVACLGAVIVGVRGSPFMFLEMPVNYTHSHAYMRTHT